MWNDQKSEKQMTCKSYYYWLLYAENQKNPDSILVEIQLSDIDVSTSDKPGNLLQILGTA